MQRYLWEVYNAWNFQSSGEIESAHEFEFHGSFNMNSEEYIRLSEIASIQSQPVALVSEKEYEYGADAFEIYMKENKGKIKLEMKEVAVQKNEKAR